MQETCDYGTQLQECLKKYQELEMQIYNVDQSKLKALIELEEWKMRNEMLNERLQCIHDNYMSCVKKLNDEHRKDEMHAKIQMLTTERDSLKKRLIEYKQSCDENNEKITKLTMTIEIEKVRFSSTKPKIYTYTYIYFFNIPSTLHWMQSS